MIEGVYLQKTLADGRIATVTPLTFHRARITVGPDEEFIDDGY